jgi:hypothetical protein
MADFLHSIIQLRHPNFASESAGPPGDEIAPVAMLAGSQPALETRISLAHVERGNF